MIRITVGDAVKLRDEGVFDLVENALDPDASRNPISILYSSTSKILACARCLGVGEDLSSMGGEELARLRDDLVEGCLGFMPAGGLERQSMTLALEDIRVNLRIPTDGRKSGTPSEPPGCDPVNAPSAS